VREREDGQIGATAGAANMGIGILGSIGIGTLAGNANEWVGLGLSIMREGGH
jgi:hypothetical protein